MRGRYAELYRRPLSGKTSTELKLLIGAWSPSPRAHEACLVGSAIYGDPVGRVNASLGSALPPCVALRSVGPRVSPQWDRSRLQEYAQRAAGMDKLFCRRICGHARQASRGPARPFPSANLADGAWKT